MKIINFLFLLCFIAAISLLNSCKKTSDDSVPDDSNSDTLTWKVLNLGTFDNLRSVSFINKDTGYVAGLYGFISKTTDGGSTWKSVTPYKSSVDMVLTAACFLNKDTGFVAGSEDLILRTKNGGISWDTVHYSGAWSFLSDMIFTSKQIGYAIGDNVLLKTENGGQSWVPVSNSPTGKKILFISPTEGFIVSTSNIKHTTNGGTSWETISINDQVSSIGIIDNKTFCIGATDKIYKTIDGGKTFPKISNIQETVEWINFLSSKVGIAISYSQNVFRTEDGGETWKQIRTGTFADNGVNSISFVKSGYCFLACDLGIVVKAKYK